MEVLPEHAEAAGDSTLLSCSSQWPGPGRARPGLWSLGFVLSPPSFLLLLHTDSLSSMLLLLSLCSSLSLNFTLVSSSILRLLFGGRGPKGALLLSEAVCLSSEY